MSQKRKAYAPFSLTSEAGVGQTPVEGYIDVNQMIYPSVDTGVIDENGEWKGVKSSDKEFQFFTKDEAVQDGQDILTPTANADGSWPLNMAGFVGLYIAIKPTRTGTYGIEAIMGPDSNRFVNLSPVKAAVLIRGNVDDVDSGNGIFDLLIDSSEQLYADKWNIFFIGSRLREQRLLQFKITNNSGGEANIECAYMRTV
jgi:hypothetical protein